MKTLVVNDGRQITFTNGTLNRDSTLAEPVLLVSNGGTATVSVGATITGSGEGSETIRLASGSLTFVENGTVRGTNLNSSPAVRLTSSNDHLHVQSGYIYGKIMCEATGADIQLTGGYISFNYLNLNFKEDNSMVYSFSDVTVNNIYASGSDYLFVTLKGSSVIKLQKSLKIKGLIKGLSITAPDKGNEDVLVEGSGYQLTQDDKELVTLKDKSDYQVILKKKKNQITLYYDDLLPLIKGLGDDDDDDDDNDHGDGTEDNPYKANIPCEGVNVSEDTEFDDLYWFITGMQKDDDDCQGSIDQEDGDIIIKKDATVTFDSIYFRGCGCSHYIHVYGTLIIDYSIYIINYWRFIYVHPGGRVIIRDLNGEVTQEVIYIEGGRVEYHGGNVSGGTYGWYNVGGTIYIYGGTIKGGTAGGYTGGQGTTYIYGGTIYGGFVNYGTTYWYGGTVTGGTDYTVYNYKGGRLYIYGGTCTGPGTIWNEGDLYIDGSNKVSVQDIYLIKGCHVYVLSKLTYKLRLHITVDNIVLNTPIILGGNGYRLTKEDCSMLEIILPDGYTWHYDETAEGVVITSSTGINQITIDKTTIDSKVYSVDGNRRSVPAKGLNIIRYSDGTVRKVVVK